MLWRTKSCSDTLSCLFTVLFPVKLPSLLAFVSSSLVPVFLHHADKLLAPPAADSDGESDGSDRVPVPSFQNSFSQAIEKALLQLDEGAASPPQPGVDPGLRSRMDYWPRASRWNCYLSCDDYYYYYHYYLVTTVAQFTSMLMSTIC